MVQARVKADSRWATVTACGGAEFIRDEWRNVPDGREAEAGANPFLEVQDVMTLVLGHPQQSAPNETITITSSDTTLEILDTDGTRLFPALPTPANVTIDTSDGVQPAEASAAGRVLQQSPKKPNSVKPKKGKK